MVEADLVSAFMRTAVPMPMGTQWAQRGWLLIPGFLAPNDIERYRREADRLWADQQLFAERGSVLNSRPRSDRLDPVIDLSPAFARLALDRRIQSIVENALGGPPQLMKDKFIAKPPGATGYSAHQDAAYWPGLAIDPKRVLTAVIYLDHTSAENGAIECVRGHKALLTNSDLPDNLDEDRLGPFETVDAPAGSLLLLHALTPHRSGANRSQSMRRALLFTYAMDPRPDLYAAYKQWRSGLSV